MFLHFIMHVVTCLRLTRVAHMWVSLLMAILTKKSMHSRLKLKKLKLKLKLDEWFFWTGRTLKKGQAQVLTFPVTCARNSKLKLKLKLNCFFHEQGGPCSQGEEVSCKASRKKREDVIVTAPARSVKDAQMCTACAWFSMQCACLARATSNNAACLHA